LKNLYEQLAPFLDDHQIDARVRYWRGFALWRRALNGFNESVDRVELEQDLRAAVDEFDNALVRDPNFVDAKIGAGSCLLNLVFIHQKDVNVLRTLLVKAMPLLTDAEIDQPDNPRLLWVLGANRWYNPPERGGGKALALKTYEKGLAVARRHKVAQDPLMPSWGEPELQMNLAWSNLNQPTPDLEAAERHARAALAIVPYWHYVKDILLPQIMSLRKIN
jgi:hypothetical protein